MPARGGPVVTVQGVRRLARTLRDFGVGLDDLKDANASASALVARESAARAPHKSGALAKSVRGSRQAARAVVAAGGARVPYAGPIHWGWPARGIPARPFMLDAAQATQDTWLADYEAEIEKLARTVEGA
jgi:phage gpG-like protein